MGGRTSTSLVSLGTLAHTISWAPCTLPEALGSAVMLAGFLREPWHSLQATLETQQSWLYLMSLWALQLSASSQTSSW